MIDTKSRNEAVAPMIRSSEGSRAPWTELSVLMATYAGEKASNLELALRSTLDQTLRPSEIVLVLDGPVGADQEDVVDRLNAEQDGDVIKLVRMPKQGGLANALNEGLGACSHELVARMDSDDVCDSRRFEIQIGEMSADPSIDVVFAWQAEFETDPSQIERIKRTPVTEAEIKKLFVWRCPVSHPTVLFRRSKVLQVGGYRSIGRLEDYDLHLRLFHIGARYKVVPQALVKVRVTPGQRRRRGGLDLIITDWNLRYPAYRRGFMTLRQLIMTMVAWSVFRVLPTPIKSFAYSFVRTRTAK